MIKKQDKVEKIDQMLDLFSKVITALTILRDEDVSETQVLHDLGINKNTFRRVVYDLNWNEADAEFRGSFKQMFSDAIPTRNWAEDLFCEVMGLSLGTSSCGKIPEDITETMETIIDECLTDSEKTIIDCLYKECMTLRETAEVLHLSDSRIQQKRHKIQQKLRNRNRRYYMVCGNGYWYQAQKMRDQVLHDLYVEHAQKELSRLNRELEYKRCVLKGIPVPKHDMLLEDLGLSVRAYNCLWRAGYRTLGQIAEHTEEEITKVRNLGCKAFDEVKNALTVNGYEFKKEETK